jgi:hypothetical protein
VISVLPRPRTASGEVSPSPGVVAPTRGGSHHQASSSSQKGSSQQTSEPTTNETSVGCCADNANASAQQGEASRDEVSDGKIAFGRWTASGSDIFLIDEEGTCETGLTRTEPSEESPGWSPDRQKIAFLCPQGPGASQIDGMVTDLCVINTDGSEWTRLVRKVPPELFTQHAAWGSG